MGGDSGDLKARFEAAAKEIAAWKPAGKDPSDDEKLVRGYVGWLRCGDGGGGVGVGMCRGC